MAPRVMRRQDVERELARARGARRVLPWAIATAVSGGLIALVAGGGLRAGAAVAAMGLVFALFVWTTSVARCPACGAPLPRAGTPDRCARCGSRFE